MKMGYEDIPIRIIVRTNYYNIIYKMNIKKMFDNIFSTLFLFFLK